MVYLNLALTLEDKSALKEVAEATDRKMNRIISRHIKTMYEETFGKEKFHAHYFQA